MLPTVLPGLGNALDSTPGEEDVEGANRGGIPIPDTMLPGDGRGPDGALDPNDCALLWVDADPTESNVLSLADATLPLLAVLASLSSFGRLPSTDRGFVSIVLTNPR